MENTTELYTDESPGLKVDPVVVLVLSLGFIFSVVALHSMSNISASVRLSLVFLTGHLHSHRQDHTKILVLMGQEVDESVQASWEVPACDIKDNCTRIKLAGMILKRLICIG